MSDSKDGPTPKAPQNAPPEGVPQVVFVFESTTFPTFNWGVGEGGQGMKMLELTVPQTGKQMKFPFSQDAAKKLGMALMGSGIQIPELDLSRLKGPMN